MAYTPTYALNYARVGNWYEVSDFLDFLDAAQDAAFSVQTVRDGLRDSFNSLPRSPPFSLDTRFPSDFFYISGFKSKWNQLIIQMTTALSYKPGSKDTKSRTVDTTDTTFDNDVTQSFFQAIKAMKETIMQPPANKDLFDRDSFEKFFNLTWINP
uniref:Coat protein n=1 Tax=Chara australis virus TaxID=1051671 RepID=F8ULT8_9VIRU|nr:coat protein [Chara australis virus]